MFHRKLVQRSTEEKTSSIKTHIQIVVMAFLSLAYIIWASAFIYRSSFIGIDGVRHFSLFDDAMISMCYTCILLRYASCLNLPFKSRMKVPHNLWREIA